MGRKVSRKSVLVASTIGLGMFMLVLVLSAQPRDPPSVTLVDLADDPVARWESNSWTFRLTREDENLLAVAESQATTQPAIFKHRVSEMWEVRPDDVLIMKMKVTGGSVSGINFKLKQDNSDRATYSFSATRNEIEVRSILNTSRQFNRVEIEFVDLSLEALVTITEFKILRTL
jgi:hypothetical protein